MFFFFCNGKLACLLGNSGRLEGMEDRGTLPDRPDLSGSFPGLCHAGCRGPWRQ